MTSDADALSEVDRLPPDAQAALARLLGVTGGALERSAQLQRALETRIVIEQAKGMLAERLGLGVDEAFELIRRGARDGRIRLHELAGRVVSERETPAEIARLLL
ncbi:MAG: ANTAR domain-containing protein [Gaiellaceae bacterium]